MTRSCPLPRSLLSNFNQPSDEPIVNQEVEPEPEKNDPVIDEETASTSDEELSSISSNALDELEVDTADPKKGEPESELDEDAINAPPASSSEDGTSDSDASHNSPGKEKETIDEKLAVKRRDTSSPSWSWGGGRGSQSRSLSSRKGTMTRTSSNVADNDSDSDDAFSSWTQRSKKRSRINKSYGKGKFPGPPSSSARTAATPDRQSSDIEPDTEDETKKLDKSLEVPDRDNIFRTPMQIDFDRVENSNAEGDETSEIKVSSLGSTSGSSLETMASSGIQIDTAATSPAEPSAPPPSLCPWCKKEVDPGILMLFEAQPRQRLREQRQFCASHQQNTAEREWEARKYPDINWDLFDERVQGHFPALEELLVPDCSSYFRNILDENLKKGKAKNFRLTLAGDGLETISCGYYGTRGAAKM